MAGKKREKELARAKYERQQERRSQRESKHRRLQRIIAAAVVIVLIAGGVGWFLLARGTSSDTSDASASSQTPAPTASPSTTPTSSLQCSEPGTLRTNDLSWPTSPAEKLNPKKSYTLSFDTNCGTIEIATDPKLAPLTANSEVFLTKEGFYNDTSCHRLTTSGIYVLQCGDPEGTGSGGPGYTVPDENLPKDGQNNYPAGTVAMANAGPGTSGSQFFIVYQDTSLPPAYTIWGTVTKGLDIVQQVAAAGTADGGSDGKPAQPVFITKGTVRES